jgi:hypothetical protein
VDGISIIDLTPAGLLLIVVLMIVTGRLVPRSTYQEKVAEAERWRAAYEVERTARTMTDAHTRELLEVAKTSEKFLTAVFDNSERILNSGDS